MIVVDLETSGLDSSKCGIWQIGAVDIFTKEEFFQESRIDEEDVVVKEALIVTGKTEAELRDSSKQSQKKLLENFSRWFSKRKNRIFVAQNPQFDFSFLSLKYKKYELKMPFGYRALDLHTLASLKYFQLNGKFLLENKSSGMSLSKIADFCGIEDTRRILGEGKIIKEGESHNALGDARLEAECLSRIVFGKNLLREYSASPIPNGLRK